MNCSKCGAQIADDAAICPVCGNMVNGNTGNSSTGSNGNNGMGFNSGNNMGNDGMGYNGNNNMGNDGMGYNGSNSAGNDGMGYNGNNNMGNGSQGSYGNNGMGNDGMGFNNYNGNFQRETQAQYVRQPRSIAMAIIFTIITCGIYGIYWFIVLTDEVNDASGEIQGTSGGIAFLLTLVTCGIYGIYWAYKQGEKLDRAKMMRGIPSSNSGVLYLILELLGFGIIAWALMQNELNKMY